MKIVKSVYISYNAATEPIVNSQVTPYLRELSKKGIKFYLITFEKKNLEKNEKVKILKSLQSGFQDGLELEWHPLRYHKSPKNLAKIFDIIWGIVYVFLLALIKRAHVIHGRALPGGIIGFPAAKILFKKFIFDTRGIDSEEYVDAGLWKKGSFKYKLALFAERLLTRKADYVIVLTEKFLEILKEKYKGYNINFSVIPCAVDTARFSLKGPGNADLAEKLNLKGKFVFTYIGSLGTWYMFSEMADFFKTALGTINNAHFLVLSQVDTRDAEKIIKEKGIEKSRYTIGAVSYEDVPRALALSGAGIFFIKPVFSKLSSSPVKFGEYLASGLPIVTNYGIGDTEETVRKSRIGVVIDNFNSENYRSALAELKNLMNDKALAARCRAVAEKHLSLESAAEKYATIYKKLSP